MDIRARQDQRAEAVLPQPGQLLSRRHDLERVLLLSDGWPVTRAAFILPSSGRGCRCHSWAGLLEQWQIQA